MFAGSIGGIFRGIQAKAQIERQRSFYNAYVVTYNNRRLIPDGRNSIIYKEGPPNYSHPFSQGYHDFKIWVAPGK